jgi:hypothetical protein
MPKTIYVCEYCKRQFESRMDARWCEIQHETKEGRLVRNTNFLEELKRNHKNPCLYCQRPYYVYGTEFHCECSKHCKDYNLFIVKENL